MGGAAGAAVLWARADVRARWRSLVVLGLIAGVTAGLALGCLIGAQRTGSALDRLEARTSGSDAIVFPSQVGVTHPDYSALRARPEVAALGPWALVFGDIEAYDEGEELFFVPAGDEFFRTVDRPVVVEGRMWDPDADDELVIGEGFARAYGIPLGFTTGFQPLVSADFDAEGARLDAPPAGPHLEMRVVGIVRTPLEPLFVSDGFAVASPGLLTRHPDVFDASAENVVVRLADRPGAQADLLRDAESTLGEGVPVLDLDAVARRVTTTTDVERTVLLLLAAVIALAGLVLAGQVVVRSASTIASDAPTLEAMGLDRRSVAGAALLAHLPAAVVAGGAAVGAAVVAAGFLPFGIAGRLDPDTGVRTDALVLALGSLAVVALVLGACFATGWRAARPSAGALSDETRGVVGWLRRHSSVVVGLGATMAFRRTSGARGVPVRPALLGAVVGVLGVAAAATVDAGLHDALHHPERAGVVWDVSVVPPDPTTTGGDGALPSAAVDRVLSSPGVRDAATIERVVRTIGGLGAPVFSVEPLEDDGASPMELTTVDGRAPERSDEVALGPQTARALGLGIGDDVQIGGSRSFEIVGTALFPSDVHSGFDEGAWVLPEGQAELEQPPHEYNIARFLALRLDDGASVDEVVGTLGSIVEPFGGFALPAERPPELLNLRDIVPLPRWLGAFLALLGLAALLHVLSSSARARARDFAVLRAIGVTRRGTHQVLNVHGVAVFVLGLLLGVPLGIAAGRVGWRLIAERVPLGLVSPFAAAAIVLLVPTALLLSQVLAAAPGWRLRRLRPAEVLRSE